MTEGLFALLGVALGVLMNWLVARSGRRAERRERRRRELLDLTAEFLSDVDVMWAAASRLDLATLGMVRENERTSDDVRQHHHDERLAALEERREPERRSRLALMTFRIVAPSVVDLATDLRDASARFEFEKAREFSQRRDDASTAFIHAVQELTRDEDG